MALSLKNFLQKEIIVTQVGSSSKLTDRQKANLIGLGLRGIGTNSKLVCSESVFGMIKKVEHLLKVSAV